MSPVGDKFVRFADWRSENSYNSENWYSGDEGFYGRRVRPFVSGAWVSVRRGWDSGSERLRSMRKPLNLSFVRQGKQPRSSDTKVLDPQSSFLQTWNKVFVLVCVFALAVDPLFFYIPVINKNKKCLDLDKNLEIIACAIRSFIDAVYLLRIVFQFRTGYIPPSSRMFGRRELVDDPVGIAKRYLTSYFFVDVLAILPLPQIVVLSIIPSLTGPVPLVAKNLLKYIVLVQYIPRIIRIYPLYEEVTRTSGILMELAWMGAAYNLLLYLLASHIIGSIWYLLSIEREDTCWRKACHNNPGCDHLLLYCGKEQTQNNSFLNVSCPFIQPDEVKDFDFNFGIFFDALDSHIVESTDFMNKMLYCFWWGLRNLSSLGQNLKTSTFNVEILFAVFISVIGLVLFALLIGNMQKYLQSTTVRIEEMRVKRRDAEQWMSHRMLPDKLKERIRRYEQYKWQETRGVEERSLIRNLPKDLRRDINRHLCANLLKKVPMFMKMDEQILDAVYDYLRPSLYTKNSYIIREGDPVDEMIFIIRGDLESATTNGGRTGFFNVVHLTAGDFCGEGLLTWALDTQSSSNLPISTRTVQAMTEVEAFALVADDLKTVASQFRRRLHHKDIQHIFRWCSVQWRTWAACFIQAAWRRYSKRKLAKALQQEEDKLDDLMAQDGGASPSLAVTIYASRFAANALRNLRKNDTRTSPRIVPQRMPLLPPKPAEPDFTT